jgi:hypothetical protein
VLATQHVKVKVIDGLPTLFADVGQHSVSTLFNALISRNKRADLQQVSEKIRLIGCGLIQRIEMRVRNNQNVRFCLRADVAERANAVILVQHVGGHITVCDLAENTVFRHRFPFSSP